MGALVCDICGGKLVMGSGGIATCDSCGMEYSKERVKEKVQEIKGVVQIDNSNQLANWIRMGDNALEAQNYTEAYGYFTKVIETDPNNWEATIKRGVTAYWQGTIGDPRLNEAAAAIKTAMEIVDGLGLSIEEKAKAKIEIFKQGFNVYNQYWMTLNMELMNQQLNSLMSSYSSVNTDLYYKQIANNKARHELVCKYIPAIAAYDTPEAKEYLVEMYSWRISTLRDYCKFDENDGYYYGASDKEKKPYVENFLVYLDEMLAVNPDYTKKENFEYPDPYDRPRNSAEYEKRKKDLPDYWKRQKSTLEAKKAEAERKKKMEEYWNAHPDEKVQLESELESIKKEVSELNSSIRQYEDRINNLKSERNNLSVPAQKQLTELRQNISSLTAQRDKCGLFQGKMKKELQSQIDGLNQEEVNIKELEEKQLKNAKEEINNKIRIEETEMKPYKDRVVALNKREVEIKSKLSCPC